jgi:hypothetical protein
MHFRVTVAYNKESFTYFHFLTPPGLLVFAQLQNHLHEHQTTAVDGSMREEFFFGRPATA